MMRSRKCLLVALTLLGLFVTDAQRDSVAVDQSVATSNPLQAVRLRKLHLVRPDLINYPLAFEVVC